MIDTSDLPLAELRKIIEARFRPELLTGAKQPGLVVSLVSFAFPAGLPREADMVFDARFLRNPHYDPILRSKTGLDSTVAAYVAADTDFDEFTAAIKALLVLVLPRFVQEGKKYATIAVGCTGGRHRSVHIVELLAGSLPALFRPGSEKREWQVTVTHRELEREASFQTNRAASVYGDDAGQRGSAALPIASMAKEF